MNLDDLARLAHDAARIATETQTKGLVINPKPDGTKVTSADLAISDHLRHFCQKRRIGFLGEEQRLWERDHTKTVVADELDGTGDFIREGVEHATALTYCTFASDTLTPQLAAINNWQRLGCYLTDGERIWRSRADRTTTEVVPTPGQSTVISVVRWPTAWYPMATIAATLASAGLAVNDPGSVVTPMLQFITGEVDAILFPGANNAAGQKVCSGIHEAIAISLFATACTALVSDFQGNDCTFATSGHKDGAPEFLLTQGFMVARNKKLQDQLLSVIDSHVSEW